MIREVRFSQHPGLQEGLRMNSISGSWFDDAHLHHGTTGLGASWLVNVLMYWEVISHQDKNFWACHPCCPLTSESAA